MKRFKNGRIVFHVGDLVEYRKPVGYSGRRRSGVPARIQKIWWCSGVKMHTLRLPKKQKAIALIEDLKPV